MVPSADLHCDNATLEPARLQPEDAQALADVVAQLPANDLLFLRRDIGQPKLITAGLQASAEGRLHSLAVRDADDPAGVRAGCPAIAVDALR